MKTVFTTATLVLTINLTTWLGGLGFPAWAGMTAAALFIGGAVMGMNDYNRLLRDSWRKKN
jgi:hypothetical protein